MSERLGWELQWVPEGVQGVGRAGYLQACSWFGVVAHRVQKYANLGLCKA